GHLSRPHPAAGQSACRCMSMRAALRWERSRHRGFDGRGWYELAPVIEAGAVVPAGSVGRSESPRRLGEIRVTPATIREFTPQARRGLWYKAVYLAWGHGQRVGVGHD